MSETFAERLKRLRQAAGLTQTTLSELCGCSEEAVCHWEGARSKPNFDRMPSVARALKCSLDMLVTGRETPQLAALLRAIRTQTPMTQLLAMVPRDA